MANKRQKKKQQAKKNVNILQKAGVPKKQIKQVKNKPTAFVFKLPEVKQYRKKEKSRERHHRATERGHILRGLTDDKKLIRYLQYTSEENYQSELKRLERNKKSRERYQKKKGPPKRPTHNKKLVALWKDKTEFNDEEFIMDAKRSYSKESIPQLISTINGLEQVDFGAIGEYRLTITTDPKETISYYRGEYIPVYSGNASNYQKLLVALAVLSLGIYQKFEKDMLLREFIFYVNEINPRQAKRLANDFHIQ